MIPGREPEQVGAFRIERKIGGGAFKAVYAAVNEAPIANGYPERVALCVPRQQDDEARRLLEKECEIMASLAHPNIVGIHGIEEDEETFFAVTELIEGETLQEALRRRGPIPFDETLAIVSQIGKALDFAHAALAIHRDIKPANVMLSPDGSVKVLDFGLARLMAHSQYRAVTTVGTVGYMAPEQFEGRTGMNSDLWSLGLTCYQLLTNVHPFPFADEGSLMRAILYEAPDLAPVEHGDFDPRLTGIFRKILSKDPEKRYRKAADFVADLEAVGRHAAAVSQQEGKLESLLRAHFPLVWVCTHEEDRAIESLRRVRSTMAAQREIALYVWSETRGLCDGEGRPLGQGTAGDPVTALQHVATSPGEGIFVFLDLHRHLSPVVTRLVRDAVWAVKRQRKSLLIVSPGPALPPELQQDATLFFFDLPELEDLRLTVDRCTTEALGADAPPPDPEWRENMAAAVLGMTRREAERTIMRSLLRRDGAVAECVEDVFQEKRQAVRKAGVLEHCAPGLSGSDVGGLEALKTWFARRRQAFSSVGGRFGLARAKGVVLVGVSGCGKSLSAKALAGAWNVPLLRLDMGRIYGSLMGQSESRLRQALSTAECVSPCILWIDELEKAFAGIGGQSLDGGSAQRVFGAFLGWLSDHRSAVFVVATANDISKLPPEFTRAGRFDAIFFVDLPSPSEREEIFRIHLKARKRTPEEFELSALVSDSAGYSGAEIAEAVINGLHNAFEQGCRPLTTQDILDGLKEITPLSCSRARDLAQLRAWATQNARPASANQHPRTK